MKFGVFEHDANARSDQKILNLLADLGSAGYGVYFMLLEELYSAKDNELPLQYKFIASKVFTTAKFLEKIITNYDLFEIDNQRQVFYSKRMKEYGEKQKKFKEMQKLKIKKRWNTDGNTDGNTNARAHVYSNSNSNSSSSNSNSSNGIKVSNDFNFENSFSKFWSNANDEQKQDVINAFKNYAKSNEIKNPDGLVKKIILDTKKRAEKGNVQQIETKTIENHTEQVKTNVVQVKRKLGEAQIEYYTNLFKTAINKLAYNDNCEIKDEEIYNITKVFQERIVKYNIEKNPQAYISKVAEGIYSDFKEIYFTKKLQQDEKERIEEMKNTKVGKNLKSPFLIKNLINNMRFANESER